MVKTVLRLKKKIIKKYCKQKFGLKKCVGVKMFYRKKFISEQKFGEKGFERRKKGFWWIFLFINFICEKSLLFTTVTIFSTVTNFTTNT